jgi:hypothetical protein
LAKLQTTVRSFYNIDGSSGSDLLHGCCSPCLTLVRIENEVLFRERQHQRLKELNDPEYANNEAYKSQSPMVSNRMWTPEWSEGRVSSPKADDPRKLSRNGLSTIEETALERPSRSTSVQKGSDVMSTESQDEDSTYSDNKAHVKTKKVPFLKHLNHAWHVTPTHGQPNAFVANKHGKGSQQISGLAPETARGAGEVSDSPKPRAASPDHTLERDRDVTVGTTKSSHDLAVDAAITPQPRSSKFTEHFLEDHEQPTHQLGDDVATAASKGTLKHDITEDHASTTGRVGTGGAHSLDDDAMVLAEQTKERHKLDKHETAVGGVERPPHAITEDAATAAGRSAAVKHGLQEHDGKSSRD